MVTTTAKAVAQTVAGVVGGRLRVQSFSNQAAEVDVLTALDRPGPGWTTYSTLTLHQTSNLYRGRETRVEIIGVAPSDKPDFGLVITGCAFSVVTDRWVAAPGVVFANVVSAHAGLSEHLPHIMFTTPFPWDALVSFQADGQDVLGLLACPISDAERHYLNQHGYDALEELFAEHDVSHFDLDRRSLV